MADCMKGYSVEEVVNFCLQTDESDIGSSCRGMSSGEEDRLDRALLGTSDIDSEKKVIFMFFLINFFFLDKKTATLIIYI